jgi:hypothetical protein
VLSALAVWAIIKGGKPIPWETQSFGEPISAVISPIITDYQAQQLAVHANHQRQKAERLAREANPSG